MPFILILFAGVLLVTGIRGTWRNLGSLLQQDFTGKNNFGIWLFAFFLIGSLGYIPSLKKLSDGFLVLVIVVIILANDKNGTGFFKGIKDAMSGTGSASGTSTGTSASILGSNYFTLAPLPPLISGASSINSTGITGTLSNTGDI